MDESQVGWRYMTVRGIVVRGAAELLGVLLTDRVGVDTAITLYDAASADPARERLQLKTLIGTSRPFRCPKPWRFDQGIYLEYPSGGTVAAVVCFNKLPD